MPSIHLKTEIPGPRSQKLNELRQEHVSPGRCLCSGIWQCLGSYFDVFHVLLFQKALDVTECFVRDLSLELKAQIQVAGLEAQS